MAAADGAAAPPSAGKQPMMRPALLRAGLFLWVSRALHRSALVDFAPFIWRVSEACMGKGDTRSKRGKIYRGSFGKSRAKDPAKKKKRAAAKK